MNSPTGIPAASGRCLISCFTLLLVRSKSGITNKVSAAISSVKGPTNKKIPL